MRFKSKKTISIITFLGTILIIFLALIVKTMLNKQALAANSQESILKAYKKAQEILSEHIDKLNTVAGILLEKEKIDGEEFAQIFEEQ